MGRDVLMSLNPQWFVPIMQGKKTIEVRKRAPLQEHPYKVYLYCTKGGDGVFRFEANGQFEPYLMNGTVCGEFTCVSTTEYTPPWGKVPGGTYLSAKQLYEYQGTAEKLCFMAIQNPILYDEPLSLTDFGLKRAPMSWQYVERRK